MTYPRCEIDVTILRVVRSGEPFNMIATLRKPNFLLRISFQKAQCDRRHSDTHPSFLPRVDEIEELRHHICTVGRRAPDHDRDREGDKRGKRRVGRRTGTQVHNQRG